MRPYDVYSQYPVTPVSGHGFRVTLDDGREILDFYGGHAVVSIGHAHPSYVQAIEEQVGKLGFYSNAVRNPLQLELANLLGEVSGLEDYRLFLVNSGAEANENALKLAAWETGRGSVLAFGRGWHGRTSAAVSVTDDPPIKSPINHGVPTEWLPLNDGGAAAARIAEGDLAAVIVEGIQGIGGIHVPDPEFLQVLAEACKKAGTCLILDEIQSGYGRSGKFFAFQHAAGVEPDLVTVAKGMGNGFPIGGVLIHPRLAERKGSLGTTFGGNHLACAAGIAVLEVLRDEGLCENAAVQGAYLLNALRQNTALRDVRGRGLMIGFEVGTDGPALRKKLLLKDGVFVGSAKDPATIRLLPPLVVDRSACDELLSALAKRLGADAPSPAPPATHAV